MSSSSCTNGTDYIGFCSQCYIYIHKFAYVYAQFEHTYKTSALNIFSGTIHWLKAL